MLIMDAMPLPNSAINPKIVLPNLSSRAVGSEIRVSDGTDASISVRNRDSVSTSSRNDIKFSGPVPNKKPSSEFPVPAKPGTSMSTNPNPNFKPDPNPNPNPRKTYNGEIGMILSLPKQDPKNIPKRSIKLINIAPPSNNKRPKIEQLETPVCTDVDAESARISKQRRCGEGKRDKKSVRGNLRSKNDFGVNKSFSVNYDSALGGASILGMYGLKIDMHDITKNMEDLSLKELLEGSRSIYRHTSFNNRENKGKKSTCSKDELILSVNKAYSLNNPINNNNHNNNNNNNDINNRNELSKGFVQINPRELLEQLSLNPDQNLNSIVISANPTPLLSSLNAANLPQFNWSTSQCVAHKSNFDSVRAPWVRIGGNLTSSKQQSNNNNNKLGVSLLEELEKIEKEVICDDEKVEGLNCKKEDSRRGDNNESASVSGQTNDTSKQGYSPRAVQAAEILCEISRVPNSHTISQKQTNGAIKWPNLPSLKTMKPSKPLPPFTKPDNDTTTTNNNINNNINNNNNNNNNNISNVNYNSSTSNPSPSRNLESPSRSLSKPKLPIIDRKKHDNGSSKPSTKQHLKGSNDKRPQNSTGYSSQTRLERDYENQQRIRKATLTASLNPGNSNPGISNPGISNPGNSNPGNSNSGNSNVGNLNVGNSNLGPCFGDWKRNKRC